MCTGSVKEQLFGKVFCVAAELLQIVMEEAVIPYNGMEKLMKNDFSIKQLNPRLQKALAKQHITELTDIQSLCIPQIIQGRNVSGGARTGTGKTLAYLLPVYEHMLQMTSEDTYDFICVIVVPAKELAYQISRQIEILSKNLDFPARAVVAVGNFNMRRMADMLKGRPAFVIGTSARIKDLISVKKLPAHKCRFLIFDEADKLINNDNIEAALALKKCFYRDVQTLFFTATFGEKYQKSLEKVGIDVVNIFTSKIISIPENIKHYYVVCQHRDKIETVRKVIKASGADKAIIFANSRYDIGEITQKLKYHNYKVSALHSESDKFHNKNTVKDFMDGKLQYIVASDYAARGMHFDNVSAIINIGLPEEAVDYVHRAGRCGRNGQPGMCISIITDKETNNIKKFQKALSINMIPRSLYQGKLVAK